MSSMSSSSVQLCHVVKSPEDGFQLFVCYSRCGADESSRMKHHGFHMDLFAIVFQRNQMGVSKNRGTPKWMGQMENPINMDDLG